jgi:hypothetical protein
MSKRWRTLNAYRFERTMTDPPDSIGLEQVGSPIGDNVVPMIASRDDVYTDYDAYGSELNYTTETGMVGTMGDGTSRYTADYPGSREDFHAEFEDAPMSELGGNATAVIRDDIDQQIDGQMGLVNRFPYSMGEVSSDAQENFALTGEQIFLRRDSEQRQMYGPVGTSDSSALLALAYAQQQNMYYPNEVSQADLVASV